MIKGLEAFTHGQIQDALNLIETMKRESLTENDLRIYVDELALSLQRKKSRRGFLKRTTKAQRAEILKHKGLERQPCKRCDEKRRGNK